MSEHWYYLHTNGDLIHKWARPDTSDFVRKIWEVDPTLRRDAWVLCVEAAALGANPARIKALAKRWNLTDEDAHVFAQKLGMFLRMDGDQWMAAENDFVDLQESQAGFGHTCLDALTDFARQGLAAADQRAALEVK